MTYFLYVIIFLFGLAIGSFLNVLILRLPHEQRIGGRSACPKCGHQLGWRDLVPIFSFIFLRGHCRYCGMKISWQYPIVEIITGLLFLLIFNKFFPLGGIISQFPNFPISSLLFTVYCLLLGACLIVIFVSDLRYFIIPDAVVYTAIAGAFLYQLFQVSGFRFQDFWPVFIYLLVALGASLFFLLIVVATKGKGMGLGDVKLAFLMGLVLGWPKILLALLLAFVSGALVGLALILAGRAKMKSEIPFGTFLSASTFLVMILGQWTLAKYLSLLF